MRHFSRPAAIEKKLKAIARDDRRGAAELAQAALRVFELAEPAADLSRPAYVDAVRALAREVCRLRPAMAPIGGATARLVYDFVRDSRRAPSGAEAYRHLRTAVRRLAGELAGSQQRAIDRFLERFPRVRRPIVLSYSSQVIALLERMPRATTRVTVCESRPALEGRRAARRAARRLGSVTLITEAQIGLAMAHCDAVVLGCDAIHPDGSIRNKTGSYVLALVAREKKRPVIVMGDRYKLVSSADRAFENRPAAEVWGSPPRNVRVENTYFEIVPAKLIGAIVMAEGIKRPAGLRRMWVEMRRFQGALRASAS